MRQCKNPSYGRRCSVVVSKIRGCFLLVFVFLIAGCGAPKRNQITQDFAQLILEHVGQGVHPIIVNIGPGEGDSENVYEQINFDLIAETDIVFREGWLNGISLKKGQRVYGGEVVVLYQEGDRNKWKMSWSELKKVPE